MPAFVRFTNDNIVHAGIMVKVAGQAAVAPIEGNIYSHWEARGDYYPLEEVKLLSPCMPTKIIGVGVNYHSMAALMKATLPDKPLIFFKPPSSVIGPGDNIVIPEDAGRVDYEIELAAVIKKRTRNITPGETEQHILGYTCANDITAVELVRPNEPWSLAKGYDTFTPLGPAIVTGLNPERLTLSAYLNGKRTQYGASADMHFKPAELVAYLSQIMTLEAGDVILTGTPPGKGALQRGDKVKVCISGIGCLENRVE
jgi:2-keto-4-pentenoate hydratase/2-oxohepta-3-ene-1,7-dioic acid hydratase in catechol pathway